MRTFYSFLLLLISAMSAFAQSATINFFINNTQANEINIIKYYPFNSWQALNDAYSSVSLKNGKYVYTQTLTEPTFLDFYCQKDNTRQSAIRYTFFLRPGDKIDFKADFNQPGNGIKISGKGSENNQPVMAIIEEADITPFYGDTLPNRTIALIKEYQGKLLTAISNYRTQYKPDTGFINKWQAQAAYYPVTAYFSFNENNKFQIQEAYKRNIGQWQGIQDSLFATIKFDNPANLDVPQYNLLLKSFLLREKERLWNLSGENPEAFFKDWYGTTPELGKPLFQDDSQNLLKEKIINRYFTGKTAEYLYGILFTEAIHEANPQNIPQIFERFKARFPKSVFIAGLSTEIAEIEKRQQNTPDKTIILAENNGVTLNTFEEVLAMMKGKTVLLDMWGTWCGPCRKEIEKNGKYIKKHFEGKKLDFLYIANNDNGNEKKWKELMAYFNMQGTHILANEKLSDDIMTKVKGEGYPTYVVIKKDGTYELSKAGYPMNRDVLIQQLEEAIAQ